MLLPILYKYTTRGQIQQWQIICPPNENYYYTIEGIQGGKLTTSEPTYCVGKNVGKSNETSDEQQAQNEALAKWEKKVGAGYNEVLTKDEKFFKPMLAFELKQYEKLLFTVPTFIQPKLDGVRCYLDNRKLTTRAGKPIVSCPHLELGFFGLDGELYNHELKSDFNKIISLVRKTKPEPEDLIESEKLIQYWIYDYPYYSDKVFSERYKMLKRDFNEFYQFSNNIRLVPTFQVTHIDHLLEKHREFMEQGYEGSIIRLDLGGYENKRSKQLLKYKDWQDAEWEIVDVLEGTGNRAGCANMLVIKLDSGVICKPTMTGTEEFMRKVWLDKQNVIGKQVTIKFFGYTEDGSLRFCTVKHIIGYI